MTQRRGRQRMNGNPNGSRSRGSSPSASLVDEFPIPAEDRGENPTGALPDHGEDIERSATIPHHAATDRLNAIDDTGDDYRREYRLKLLHRLLLRGIALDLIATTMEITVTEVQQLRRELNRRLKREVQEIDMASHVAGSLAFYNEVRSSALKLATNNRTEDKAKISAFSTALRAENSKQTFLRMAGFFDGEKFTPAGGKADDAVTEGEVMRDIARAILDPSSDLSILDDVEREHSRESQQDHTFDIDDDDVRLI